VIAARWRSLFRAVVEKCIAAGILDLDVIFTTGAEVSSCLRDTLAMDKCEDLESAQVDIYKRLRPSSPPTPEISASFFDNLFRNPDYYDLVTRWAGTSSTRVLDWIFPLITARCPTRTFFDLSKSLFS
jgi:hypothetical protein